MNITPKDTKTFSLSELVEKLSTLQNLIGYSGISTDVRRIEVHDCEVDFITK